MTVYKNMSFGLESRKLSAQQIDRMVREGAHTLGIEELLHRKPKELSGGQRQRVAMGRAIIRDPQVFLFDEPLSNLDAKLRVQMRGELAKLHQRLETTIIYVTHDQIEAMTLADRLVVMNDGVIMQVGEAMEVYENPKSRFVAGFIGSPAMNFVDVRLVQDDGRLYVDGGSFRLRIPDRVRDTYHTRLDGDVVFGIRPEHINDSTFRTDSARGEPLDTMVEVIEPLGSEVLLILRAGDHPLIAKVAPHTPARERAPITLYVNMDRMHLFDKETGGVIE